MQKTNFSRITYQLYNLFFGFLSDTWRTKSIGLISVLTGYFLFANFLTKFISEGKKEKILIKWQKQIRLLHITDINFVKKVLR